MQRYEEYLECANICNILIKKEQSAGLSAATRVSLVPVCAMVTR